MNKALITAALEKLGPERVERGLGATRHDWFGCFLGLACGGHGSLDGQFHRGLSEREVDAVAHAFDNYTEDFRALVREWLEANITAAPATVAV